MEQRLIQENIMENTVQSRDKKTRRMKLVIK